MRHPDGTRRCRIPRTLALVAAAVGPVAAGCASNAPADVPAGNDATLDESIDAREPTTCVVSFDVDGALLVEYLDGAVIGPYVTLPDGAAVFEYADGAVAGSTQTSPDGQLVMGGPCDRFA